MRAFRSSLSGVLMLGVGALAQLTGDAKCVTGMCVSATVNGSQVEYVLQSSSSSVGWMAIGFGKQMPNTPMVILWPNTDGTITVSQRQAGDEVMPTLVSNPPRVATLSAASSSLTGSQPKLAFTIPANSDTTQNLIYASCSTRPGSSATNAALQQHQGHGTLTLDLTKAITSSGSSTTSSGASAPTGSGGTPAPTSVPMPSSGSSTPWTKYEKLVIAHATLCGVGFLVFLPLGALLARYTRTFFSKWFAGHWIIQLAITGPIIVAGVALGIQAINESGGEHLDDTHQKTGIALFVLYFVQCALGALIHFFKPPISRRRAPQNYAHAVIGLVLIGLAFWQVRTGYRVEWPDGTGRGKAPKGVNVAWIAWVVVVPVLYVVGLALLPTQFRQEKAARGGEPMKHYN